MPKQNDPLEYFVELLSSCLSKKFLPGPRIYFISLSWLYFRVFVLPSVLDFSMSGLFVLIYTQVNDFLWVSFSQISEGISVFILASHTSSGCF